MSGTIMGNKIWLFLCSGVMSAEAVDMMTGLVASGGLDHPKQTKTAVCILLNALVA